MLKKLIEILDDRTVSSLLFSIAGLLLIMTFAFIKQTREHQADK